MKTWNFALAAVATTGMLLATSAHAYTVSIYPSSAYSTDVATMNANLGLGGGYVYEDFEDATLIPQLAVSVYNPNGYPTSFSFGSTIYPNAAWTGGTSLFWSYTPLSGQTTEFSIDGGTDSFGIGLGDFDFGGSGLYINTLAMAGIDIAAFPNFSLGGQARNGYLIVNRESGDAAISSVFISGGANQSVLTFDHVAIGVAAIPEPQTYALLLAGLGSLAGLGCAAKRSSRSSGTAS